MTTGVSNVIFNHIESSYLNKNDFLYVSNNGTVYYFIPNDGLWEITDKEPQKVLDGVDDCIIVGENLYYTISGDIYLKSTKESKENIILTKEEIFNSGQNEDLLMKTLGDGFVDNMTIYDDKLYFLVTDGYSGGIFCTNLKGKELICVNPEFRVKRFMIDNNGCIYLYGVNRENENKGLYKIDSQKECKMIVKEKIDRFYVNDGCYFYNNTTGIVSYVK